MLGTIKSLLRSRQPYVDKLVLHFVKVTADDIVRMAAGIDDINAIDKKTLMKVYDECIKSKDGIRYRRNSHYIIY